MKPKLRTYAKIKHDFSTVKYLYINLTRSKRSLIAQLRSGILPLRIETGRHVSEEVSERICCMCKMGVIEDEVHFLFDCPLYKNEHNTLLGDLDLDAFNSSYSLLEFICSEKTHKLGKYLDLAFAKRKQSMYIL